MVRNIVLVFLCLVSVYVSAKTKYKVSEMSEEENTVYGSRFLTNYQKCDGCVAIAHQFHLTFELKHKNRPESLGDLPDHELIEAMGKDQSKFVFQSKLVLKNENVSTITLNIV